MLWLKPKLNLLMKLVLLFMKCWLQGHCYQELTILLLCTLGQRYEELLSDKSWRFFFNCVSSSPCLCMRIYFPPPFHPGAPGTLIWKSWRGCSSQVLVSLRAFRTIFLPIKVLSPLGAKPRLVSLRSLIFVFRRGLTCEQQTYFRSYPSAVRRLDEHTLPLIFLRVSLPLGLRTPRHTPYDGLYGEAPPERGIFFFRLQVDDRVEISLVEVFKRVEKSVICVCKRAQKG